MSKQNLLVFTGNANRPLALAVCRQLGIPLGKAQVGQFSDGEVQVEIEENVRRQEVFVIQSTSAPTAENFMELLVLIDALKRASVASVTAVVPGQPSVRHWRTRSRMVSTSGMGTWRRVFSRVSMIS